MFRVFIQLRPEFAGLDKMGWDTPLLRSLQDAGIRDIAQNDGHLSGDFPCRTPIRESHKVGSLPRSQHAYPEFAVSSHAGFLQGQQQI
jgi:hypothetical protein